MKAQCIDINIGKNQVVEVDMTTNSIGVHVLYINVDGVCRLRMFSESEVILKDRRTAVKKPARRKLKIK